MHWLCLDLAGRMLKAKCIMLKLRKSYELVKLFNCIKIFREVKTTVSWNEFQNYFIILTWMKQHLLKFVIHNCVTQGKSTLHASQNTSGGVLWAVQWEKSAQRSAVLKKANRMQWFIRKWKPEQKASNTTAQIKGHDLNSVTPHFTEATVEIVHGERW